MSDDGTAVFLVFLAVAIAFGVGSILMNKGLGARRRRAYLQETTYECGEEPEGEAQIDFPSQHYVFAIVFVAVDVLALILALWAVSFRATVALPNNAWVTPVAVATGFTILALTGIYYVLRGETRFWI